MSDDPKWTTRPPNEALDYKPSSYAALYFNTDDPEGERRLRDYLDAPNLRAVLWNLVHGCGGIFKRIEYAEDHYEGDYASGQLGALQWVIERIDKLCTEYNVDLED